MSKNTDLTYLSEVKAGLENLRHLQPAEQRFGAAKVGFSCRRVLPGDMRALATGALRPQAGDLVLARVEKLGQHRQLDTLSGRRHLFPGDEIIVCYGNRYAPDQYEAEVPEDLSGCDLVAAGGMASRARNRHEGIKQPTTLTPLGLVADQAGEVLNLSRYALKILDSGLRAPPTFAVVGTAMNAGKTTTAAYLVRGLAMAGLRVAALKVTGTGSPNDISLFRDAGASVVMDFVDVGYASTYRVNALHIEQIFLTLLNAVSHFDVVVVEVADGVLQPETAALLRSPVFRTQVGGVLFAAGDAMGAVAGVEWLRRHRLPVLGISGLLTRAPLAVREASITCDVPCYTKEVLLERAAEITGLSVRAQQLG